MTTEPLPLTAALLAWPTGPGATPASRRRIQGWRCDPVLAPYRTPGDAALALQTAGPDGATDLLEALATRPESDGQLAALAGLGPRVARITRRCARAQVGSAELADLEAELVAGCWTVLRSMAGGQDPQRPPDIRPALRSPGGRGPDHLVGRVWQEVSGRRRTQRSRASREVSLTLNDRPDTRAARTTVEQIVVELVGLVAAGTITTGAGRILAATAAGWPTGATARAIGSSPDAVRVRRARALRHLAEAAAAELAATGMPSAAMTAAAMTTDAMTTDAMTTAEVA